MRFFWPVYFCVAVAGTVGVYVTAPLARSYVPDFIKIAVVPESPDSNTAVPPVVVMKIVPSTAKTVRPRRVTPDIASVAPAARKVETVTEQTSGAGLPRIETVDELPPALNGIYFVRRGDTPGWGMAHQRASVYKLDGSYSGNIVAGTLVEYCDLKKSSKGTMVECVVIMDRRRSEQVLVSSTELRLFTGSYEKLSGRQIADLKKYYVLNGKIAERKSELLKIAAAKNPYFSQYEAAHKKLMSHIDRVKELIDQRDKATGLIKMRLEDQLRTMKYEDGRVRAEYDAIHKKFREWKEQNADAVAKPEKDPEIIKFSGEMAELRKRVPGLAI